MNGDKSPRQATSGRSIGLVLIVVVLLCVLVPAAPRDAPPRERDLDAYLTLRQDVVDALQSSFQHPHPVVAKGDGGEAVSMVWSPEAKQHLRHLLMHRQYDGQSVQKYLIPLAVEADRIIENRQQSSLTMVTTEILDHYLSPLQTLGLECRSTPMAAIDGGTQYSSVTWYPKDRWEAPVTADSPVWVEAQAFYAKNTSVIIMRLTIGGRYIPHGKHLR